ncbi:MAG: sulfate ABC transporter permease subunit CysW [Zoogloeaceae bacterium]|jgi:sulfate transport system permease protein|nr:sulfate ABC transporter permease subunit CysW [Zoogloeaceae bacterium]
MKAIRREPRGLRLTLLTLGGLFLLVFLILPVATVFASAFQEGWARYGDALQDPDVLSALRLTLVIAGICVPVNTLIGILLAWCIARFSFRGKALLTSLIETPFAISPVIVGLMFVILFGAHSALGRWLDAHDLHIVFALPGMALATAFVTLPFVARTLIPLMQAQGQDAEEAALTLGASGWQIFWRVTLPNIKWGLLYGIVLTNARAIGEFGAVAVVSGLIRGQTTTLPLMIGILFDEYAFTAAFAASTLMAFLAIFTVIAKSLLERWIKTSSH